MGELIAIALGGSIGAVMRFWLSTGVYAWLGREFPYGTLSVNVMGSFLIGIAFILLTERFAYGIEVRAFIMVGFLGAFTTFSTFSLETLMLVQQGMVLKAMLNISVSVILCVLASWGGIILAKAL